MRVLFDNGTPRGVAAALKDHVVEEARAHGGDTLRNGELLDAAETAGFEVFVTTGRNLRHLHPKSTFRSESGDPDGIRTRVAALKGPGPGPLDDGVETGRTAESSTRARRAHGDGGGVVGGGAVPGDGAKLAVGSPSQ